ncbi:23 kDa integral membrane protein-like isoform X4 [Phyllopteryx taeniolatus]|uniref:23 kDa integral membrane protein-like isoform X4 n=1 Tax=Phyllopteryx taeniolatus TaxID=161469 RepID=UPI002AD1DD23|nr:23 kDa integral membrane protein-like isoform X4 [Phyllopteryx taeniolatus]
MGKINGCLKCLFVFFNVVFAIIGCLLIFGVVKASVFSAQLSAVGAPGLGWAWVFAIGVLGISCLGIYAGISEKELALKIFAGFMVAGMVIMLIFGIVVVVMRNKVRDGFHSTSAEVAEPFMAEEGFQAVLRQLQESAHCCGLVSAGDWGDDIPASCGCRPGLDGFGGYGLFGHPGCKARPQGTTGPDHIYQQPCAEVLITYADFFFNIIIGFLFGFAVTALLGLLVSLLMIHQVRRHDRGAASSMAMKAY